EVYIMILPAMGMISEVIPVFSRKPIFGYAFVAGSSVAIAFLSFGVWAHHMFAVGLGDTENAIFSATSMLIAIPTGVKIFNWIATMIGGRLRMTTAMLFAVGFIAMFVIGGLSGVSLAVVPIDLAVTDSYYVVAHLHYVLFGGTMLGIFAGAYYWFPKMTGRLLSETLGRWHFWTTFAGFNLTFLPQHWLGAVGMPRRVFTYAASTGWGPLNLLSTIGAAILAIAMVIFFVNLVRSLRSGEIAGDDPWDAFTLEWATTSPPPPENFASIPAVTGRRPPARSRFSEAAARWRLRRGLRVAAGSRPRSSLVRYSSPVRAASTRGFWARGSVPAARSSAQRSSRSQGSTGCTSLRALWRSGRSSPRTVVVGVPCTRSRGRP